ncbi:hypothetical protein [Nocardioides sp. SYSU D00038]|uniref:hypothetical protein n=1 Tax=Nocardioides sp. SYSU D00038 TaxID=2812554 RepID=UPI001968618F|nr:hypothetical protein [Nocardioides sp. SYSU D00038]
MAASTTPARWLRTAAFRLRSELNQRGWHFHRLDEESRRYAMTSYNDAVPLPPGAAETLRADNPDLQELVRAYDGLTDVPAAVPSLWTGAFVDDQVSLPYFRGDNAYVWQYRAFGGGAEARTYLSVLDIEERDHLGLLKVLEEDGLFGAWTFQFGERPLVSRDLLDSVTEILYLDQQMGLASRENLSVLDIGAGYGRLAHRMSTALPNLAGYDCMDGVPYSTFLSDYYLRFRGCGDHVRAVRLDRHQEMRDHYDVAVNIHSFTECSTAAIQWWMDRVAEREVEWLLIVPNHDTDFLSTEPTGARLDFRPIIERAGYTLHDTSPRFANEELRPLIGINNHFFLFRRG